jgi:hypothetical protein
MYLQRKLKMVHCTVCDQTVRFRDPMSLRRHLLSVNQYDSIQYDSIAEEIRSHARGDVEPATRRRAVFRVRAEAEPTA